MGDEKNELLGRSEERRRSRKRESRVSESKEGLEKASDLERETTGHCDVAL